jgi:hypothetical protein
LASREEKYQEWLERLEIPITEQADIERFKEYLRDEFGITGELQIQALWSQVETKTAYTEMGIRAVIVEYPWGKELRYGIQGMPGLWGWASVKEIMEAEEEYW